MSKCIVPWCQEKSISSTEACPNKEHLAYWIGTMHEENVKAHQFLEEQKSRTVKEYQRYYHKESP